MAEVKAGNPVHLGKGVEFIDVLPIVLILVLLIAVLLI